MINENISEITLIFNAKKEENNINIFGYNFVKNNKNICRLIIDNQEYEITEKYKISKEYNNTF